MADRILKSLTFPDLPDKYLIPQGDVTEADLEDLKENGTVANARQLIPSAMETESVPYNFRTSGGSLDIGDREFDKLVGLSLPWNQLVENGNFANTTGWNPSKGTTSASNNILTITRTATGALQVYKYITTVAGHKYLVTADYKASENCTAKLRFSTYASEKSLTANTWTSMAKVLNCTTASSEFTFYCDTGQLSVDGTLQVKNAMCIDLTQLLGSTIADYLLALETATAGAGVAWFKKLFPKQYYAFQSGKIESVKVSSHDMVGFNQWDEEWENGYYNTTTGEPASSNNYVRSKSTNYINVLPNTSYYIHNKSGEYLAVLWYDSKKNFISFVSNNNAVVTTPSNARFARFYVANTTYGTTYKNDICINLHWDGARDGEYERYKKNSYALDPIELRGILKLDSNNEPYAYGDEYNADGSVGRRFFKYTFDGTEYCDARGAVGADGSYVYAVTMPSSTADIKIAYSNKNQVIVGFDSLPQSTGRSQMTVNTVKSYGGARIWDFASTISSSTDFMNSLIGKEIIYEKATPTTEEADPFTDPQTVDNWGTEQYVDKAYTDGDRDVEIPVGHETKYPVNLRDKLETAPNAPTSDGDYIVHCESGQLTYIALGSTTTIQNIITRLEALEP